MRRLALLLLVAPAFAQEGGGAGGEGGGRAAALERLHMARLAFDARLKLADMLREDGKRAEALAAYAQAVAIFESALGAVEPEERLRAVVGVADAAGPAFRGPAGRRVDNAVERGLKWLAAHQDDKGFWDADGFMEHDPAADRCDGKGAATADVEVTALATLAFLGAGYLDRGARADNLYAGNVRDALRFLLSEQREDGSFLAAEAPRSLCGSAAATLAVCEAYALTRNPRYRLPAEKGLAYLLKQQTRGAGWRVFEPNARDAAVTASCVCALASARGAGIDVPERALADALAWVESVTDKESGRAGEKAKTEWATAACLLTRTLCGQGPRAVDAIPKGAKLCAADVPRWNAEEGTIDMDYWRFGTLALFRLGGDEWRAWSGAMKAAMVDRQQAAGSRAGSWDPVGVEGGRVGATALMVANLEIYYRYAQAFGGR